MTSDTGPSPATPERAIPGLSSARRERVRALFRLVSALSPALAAHLAMQLFLTPLARRIAPGEARFLATAKALRLATPGGRLHAYEWAADSPTAPTVLLVHGWISHAARMAELVRALRGRGLRVVAFDAPAHGRSSGRRADLQSFRSAINTVLAACGPVQGVLAHSFGALTTSKWLAEDRPASVRAAVLVGMMRDAGYVFESFALTMALQPEVLARFRELFRRRYGIYPEELSTTELVRQLPLPVLVVHGEADELVPAAHASEIAAHLHDGQLLIAPLLGHGAPLRDPATVARICDFLVARLAT
jgi:alpha-beta hydrolase superfamily lysophospholipase